MAHKRATAEMNASVHGQIHRDLGVRHVREVLNHSPRLVRSFFSLFEIRILCVKCWLVWRTIGHNLCRRSYPLALFRSCDVVIIDETFWTFLRHVPGWKDQAIVLKVLHGKVIKADWLLCIATTINGFDHLLLCRIIIVKQRSIGSSILSNLNCITVRFEFIQVDTLAWNVAKRLPGFVNVLHETIEHTKLHQELSLVKIPLISVHVCLHVWLLFIPAVREVACFVQSLSKLVIVSDPLGHLVLTFLLSWIQVYQVVNRIRHQGLVAPFGEEIDLNWNDLSEQRWLVNDSTFDDVLEPWKLLNHLLFVSGLCRCGTQVVLLDEVCDSNAHS